MTRVGEERKTIWVCFVVWRRECKKKRCGSQSKAGKSRQYIQVPTTFMECYSETVRRLPCETVSSIGVATMGQSYQEVDGELCKGRRTNSERRDR